VGILSKAKTGATKTTTPQQADSSVTSVLEVAPSKGSVKSSVRTQTTFAPAKKDADKAYQEFVATMKQFGAI